MYQTIRHCRICGGAALRDFLELGRQAVASVFPHADEPDPPVAPLVLARCADCGLVQLRHTVDPALLYTGDYGYRSGTNATMRKHLAGIAEWVAARAGLAAGDIAVDIGCNDGTLLKAYRVPGLRRHGIDPIAGKFAAEYGPGIDVHAGYFSAEGYAAAVPGLAKAITSIAMFYDLERPGDFVAAVAGALAPGGVWVLEQSWLPAMLETNAFDTICHEHLEYYTLRQIERLAAAGGLRVFDVELNDCNGGSFRLAVCRADDPRPDNAQALANVRALEGGLRLDEDAPFRAFAGRIAALRDELRGLIECEVALGRRFYLYGASTKGNTLLQYCGLDRHLITAAADRNPEKWGRRTPLTGIPIVSEDEARKARPDYFLVLPWHFRDEFLAREAEYLAGGGRMLFPLPRLEVVGRP